MDSLEYKQLVDTAAKNQFLEQEDIEFLSAYFEKPLNIVVEDIISRQILLQLAHMGGKYLN